MAALGRSPRLRHEWKALWERAPDASPFQSPEWLIPWWRAFGQGTLWPLACYQEGRLAALVPLYCSDDSDGVREVRLIGSGNSDHLGALIEPEIPGIAPALWRWLARRAREWDQVDLRQLPCESPLSAVPDEAGWTGTVTPDGPCPVLCLPVNAEELSAIAPRQWDRYRYYRRRLGRAGKFQFTRAGRDNLSEHFDALATLHESRWRSRNEPGVLDYPGVRRFLREVVAAQLTADRLRLYTLWFNHRPAAAWLGFVAHGRVCYYLGGFDPEFARLNVGTIMVGYAIEAAVQEGCTEFDFLRGREEYKYHWGAVDRPTARNRLRYRREADAALVEGDQ
ncbi:MAG TPA: GNAT family N-acetyltransferase [Gemmatimonadales bacterium]|nr:GNAT family N-acetyltransferase [Gemmatimonadales bacterium]